ncbi:MCM domain-containing protein 2 [Biomphalaria glabrata]|nr:MCM domain-containing protein 2 [Biomphalaria glabrata]
MESNMGTIQNRKDILSSVLLFLDKRSEFENIRKQIKENLLKDQLVYSFHIDIDLGYLFEYDVSLGNRILKYPLESSSLFQEIIFHFCQSHDLLPPKTTLAQVYAHLKIVHFPSCGFDIGSLSDLIKYINYPGFVKVVGVVIGISGLVKYTQSTKYLCPLTECPGHDGNHYIRMHVSGALETHIVRNDFRCGFCGEILEEAISFRNLSDKMVIEIVPVKIVNSVQKIILSNERLQAISVILRDEQVNSIELGQGYTVVGTCRVDRNAEDIVISLEANNIMKFKPSFLVSLSTSSRIIQKLHDVCSRSPWLWPFFLAHIFGARIVPGGYMIKLRLLLLISLVLDPEVNYLHILSIGKESSLYFSIVQFAQKFAQRFFPVSVASPLSGKVMKDKYTWAPYFLQGGSLFMSCGGVCSLGNVSEWKKAKKEQLQTVLSTSKIFVDFSSKHTGGLNQQLSFPLKCHVWGLNEPSVKDKLSTHSTDVLNGQYSTGDLSKSFMDAFSYICFLDCGDLGTEEETARDVAQHIISSHVVDNDSDLFDIPFEEIDFFISLARQTDSKLTPAAEEVVQSYYKTSRMTRSSGLTGSHVPPSAMQTLISLAVGLAKLRLSTSVSHDDTVLAIYLYEEYLSSRFGQSCLGCPPRHNVPWSRLEELLGEQNHWLMQTFAEQLMRFCSTMMSSQIIHKEE